MKLSIVLRVFAILISLSSIQMNSFLLLLLGSFIFIIDILINYYALLKKTAVEKLTNLFLETCIPIIIPFIALFIDILFLKKNLILTFTIAIIIILSLISVMITNVIKLISKQME